MASTNGSGSGVVKKRKFLVRGTGAASLMFSKKVDAVKDITEGHDQFEERTWRLKCHVDKDGHIYMPPLAMKGQLEDSAKRLSMKVPGTRGKTFSKLFLQGVQVFENIKIFRGDGKPATRDDVEGVKLFTWSSGKRGQGGRVDRIFPTLNEWMFETTVWCFDPKIEPDTMETHLRECGMFLGFGAMRAGNGGVNGRWELTACDEIET